MGGGVQVWLPLKILKTTHGWFGCVNWPPKLLTSFIWKGTPSRLECLYFSGAKVIDQREEHKTFMVKVPISRLRCGIERSWTWWKKSKSCWFPVALQRLSRGHPYIQYKVIIHALYVSTIKTYPLSLQGLTYYGNTNSCHPVSLMFGAVCNISRNAKASDCISRRAELSKGL